MQTTVILGGAHGEGLPNPLMRQQPPDEAQFKGKLAWVARQLEPRR